MERKHVGHRVVGGVFLCSKVYRLRRNPRKAKVFTFVNRAGSSNHVNYYCQEQEPPAESRENERIEHQVEICDLLLLLLLRTEQHLTPAHRVSRLYKPGAHHTITR
jgi:hypothetical protein